jgi:hypothetical protein
MLGARRPDGGIKEIVMSHDSTHHSTAHVGGLIMLGLYGILVSIAITSAWDCTDMMCAMVVNLLIAPVALLGGWVDPGWQEIVPLMLGVVVTGALVYGVSWMIIRLVGGIFNQLERIFR